MAEQLDLLEAPKLTMQQEKCLNHSKDGMPHVSHSFNGFPLFVKCESKRIGELRGLGFNIKKVGTKKRCSIFQLFPGKWGGHDA